MCRQALPHCSSMGMCFAALGGRGRVQPHAWLPTPAEPKRHTSQPHHRSRAGPLLVRKPWSSLRRASAAYNPAPSQPSASAHIQTPTTQPASPRLGLQSQPAPLPATPTPRGGARSDAGSRPRSGPPAPAPPPPARPRQSPAAASAPAAGAGPRRTPRPAASRATGSCRRARAR